MCGRCKLETPPADLARYFGIENFTLPSWTPRLDIPPTAQLPVVRSTFGALSLGMMHWGIIPANETEPKTRLSTFNATVEKLAMPRSLFFQAAKARRCLVVADGFFEWPTIDGVKQKHYISHESGEPMAFAGLFQTWVGPNQATLDCCTIITTPSQGAMAPIHSRMPAVLPKGAFAEWLDPLRVPVGDARAFLEQSQLRTFRIEPSGAREPSAPPPRKRQLGLFG